MKIEELNQRIQPGSGTSPVQNPTLNIPGGPYIQPPISPTVPNSAPLSKSPYSGTDPIMPSDLFEQALKDNFKQALRYNEGKLQWSLVDFKSLEGLVEVLEYGMQKYTTYQDKSGKIFSYSEIQHLPNFLTDYKINESGRDNWKKGLSLDSILDSAQRHLIEMFKNESRDTESNLLHAHHIMCNMMFWVHFYQKNTLHKL